VPLFPDIDLSRFAPSQNGLPPGDTSGVLPGLETSLLHQLLNYRPGDIGICELAEQLQLTLPLADWAQYAFHVQVDVSLTATQDDPETIWTVPDNERIWLQSAVTYRSTGDNLAVGFRLIYPAAYKEVASVQYVDIIGGMTAATNIFWPDPGAMQALYTTYVPPPLLLEPGTIIQLDPGQAGVSASVFATHLTMRRTSLVRAMVP